MRNGESNRVARSHCVLSDKPIDQKHCTPRPSAVSGHVVVTPGLVDAPSTHDARTHAPVKVFVARQPARMNNYFQTRTKTKQRPPTPTAASFDGRAHVRINTNHRFHARQEKTRRV